MISEINFVSTNRSIFRNEMRNITRNDDQYVFEIGRALGLGKSEVKWELKLQMFIREMYV